MGREDDSIKIYIKDIEDKFVKDIDGNNVFTATKISDVENILLQNVHDKRKYRIFYKGKAITGKDKYKQLSSIITDDKKKSFMDNHTLYYIYRLLGSKSRSNKLHGGRKTRKRKTRTRKP